MINFKEALKKLKANQLPAGFDQWDLTNNNGITVAHLATLQGPLPEDFDKWDLADNHGRTVAHVVARWGNLPTDFDQWSLKDNDGITVAHVVGVHGKLSNKSKILKEIKTKLTQEQYQGYLLGNIQDIEQTKRLTDIAKWMNESPQIWLN